VAGGGAARPPLARARGAAVAALSLREELVRAAADALVWHAHSVRVCWAACALLVSLHPAPPHPGGGGGGGCAARIDYRGGGRSARGHRPSVQAAEGPIACTRAMACVQGAAMARGCGRLSGGAELADAPLGGAVEGVVRALERHGLAPTASRGIIRSRHLSDEEEGEEWRRRQPRRGRRRRAQPHLALAVRGAACADCFHPPTCADCFHPLTCAGRRRRRRHPSLPATCVASQPRYGGGGVVPVTVGGGACACMCALLRGGRAARCCWRCCGSGAAMAGRRSRRCSEAATPRARS
jgi:hypothetical protein